MSPIAAIACPNTSAQPYLNHDVDKSAILREIIRKIAIASLKELALALAFAALTCLFVATLAEVSVLISAAITLVAINTLIRAYGAFCSYRISVSRNKETFAYKFFYTSTRICQYATPYTFSILDQTTRDVMVHEMGHAVAATTLFQNANPRIQITPFSGGVTHYFGNRLTKIGAFFGHRDSGLIVAAAGPAFAVATSTVHLVVAHRIRNSRPTVSRYLQATAIRSVYSHVRYALSALSIKSYMPGHDFVVLRAGGIHPLAAVVAMIGLPLIVQLGLILYKK